MEDRYRTDPTRQRTRRAAAPHGEQPCARSAQAGPADPRSAAAYDRSRYRARNRDGSAAAQPQRSQRGGQAPQRSRSSVYDTGAGMQRQRNRGSRAQAPAASRHRALPDEPQRRVRGSRQQQARQRRAPGRGAHSSGAPAPRIPLPALVMVLIIALALVAFGLSRCVGGAAQQSTPQQEQTASQQGFSLMAEPKADDFLPTPYMAECDGVMLHSAVRADQLTEILIHNASYSYAKALTTKLTEATNVDVMAAHGTGRVAAEQPTGDAWLTGEFIRCFRSTNAGPKLSAIDCGGPVGATVYAPVTGTVVKVKEYSLYNNEAYPDVQVHIQPQGRPDLDVVLIHLSDVTVSEGDEVVGGATPIAAVRDVYAYVGEEMQLKSYTAEGDNGNHTHIQVNNTKSKKYHGLD